MKTFIPLALVLGMITGISAQTDLDKLVATERAFARAAAERGTKSAFLEFMASDGVVFVPERTFAKPFWTARAESNSLLSWAPNYADISSNGILGYTTGNWEYRAKGKADEPSGFGNFITVWLRQPSGQYRWVVDIGITHARPEKYSEEFQGVKNVGRVGVKEVSAADSANQFYEMAGRLGFQKAYATYAATDIRFFRENEFPGIGRGAFLDRLKKDKGSLVFPKRSVFFQSGDLAYVNNTYVFTPENGTPQNGNFLHVWKYVDGKWKIVLDILKTIPLKAS